MLYPHKSTYQRVVSCSRQPLYAKTNYHINLATFSLNLFIVTNEACLWSGTREATNIPIIYTAKAKHYSQLTSTPLYPNTSNVSVDQRSLRLGGLFCEPNKKNQKNVKLNNGSKRQQQHKGSSEKNTNKNIDAPRWTRNSGASKAWMEKIYPKTSFSQGFFN